MGHPYWVIGLFKQVTIRSELPDGKVVQNRVTLMRIDLALDLLAAAVAVFAVVPSAAASGVRKASATATFDVRASFDRTLIPQTIDGADEDKKEARMAPIIDILGFIERAPEVDPLLTESLLANTLDTDVSIKQAFTDLDLHTSPLDGRIKAMLTAIVKKEKDFDYWTKSAEEVKGYFRAIFRDKTKWEHSETALKACKKELLSLIKQLQSEIKTVNDYFEKKVFKYWLDHASSRPDGDSLTDGKYKVFSGKFGVLEAASIIEMSQFGSLAARKRGAILQEGQFDYWFSLGIQSREGVLKHLSPKEHDFEVPKAISRNVADMYTVYREYRLALENSGAVVH